MTEAKEAVFVDDLLAFAAEEFKKSRAVMDERRGRESEDIRLGARAVCKAVVKLTGADEDEIYDRLRALSA